MRAHVRAFVRACVRVVRVCDIVIYIMHHKRNVSLGHDESSAQVKEPRCVSVDNNSIIS